MAGDDDRHYPPRPILGASVAVFRGGKVLLARRGRPPLQDFWSLPGGVVEIGEEVAEAAARELMEETGVSAEIVGPAGYVDVIRRDEAGEIARHFVVIALAARHLSGEAVCGDGTAEVRWAGLDEIDGLPLTDGAADLVRKAAETVGHAREEG